VELLPLSPLRPGYVEDGNSVHRFAVPPELAKRRLTTLRLNQHPDGGIARLRVWGIVSRHFEQELAHAAVGSVDLLSASLGGRAVGCSNRHYGEPRNLLQAGRGANMGEGWETARNPLRPAVISRDAETGMVDMAHAFDWSVLRLCAEASEIERLVIDTNHFRGNYPESVLIEACFAPTASTAELMKRGKTIGQPELDGVDWQPLLERTKLGPSQEHHFDADQLAAGGRGRISHLRLTILPDGGVMRVRAFGRAAAPLPAE